MLRVNSFKLLRMKAGLTQKDLAERLGCSESLIARWETERGRPSGEKLIRLTELLGCTPDQLYKEGF